MAPPEQAEEKLAEGTLISHLLELRTRLVRILIAVAIVFTPCAVFSNRLYTALATPLLDQLPKGSSMISTSVTAPFSAPVKLALFVALFSSAPYVLHQIWGFVAPGLYRHEKRLAVPLVISSVALFYAGVAFAYLVVFPGLFQFLVATTPQGVRLMADMNEYLSFTLTMFLSFGIAFEVPIVVIMLILTGVVSPEKLKESRGYAVVGIAVIAAVLTPTQDAVSLAAMAVPMWLLYEAGIVAGRVLLKMRLEQQARNRGE